MTQTPGTPAYMPPEVMVANPKYDTSVDEFSYGIMMIHITGVRSRGAGGAVAPPSCQPSGPKPRKIFILLGLDIFRFVM